jgi:hypothetical protein
MNPDSAVEREVMEQGANLPQRRQCVLPLKVYLVPIVPEVPMVSNVLNGLNTLNVVFTNSRFAPRSLFNCGIRG